MFNNELMPEGAESKSSDVTGKSKESDILVYLHSTTLFEKIITKELGEVSRYSMDAIYEVVKDLAQNSDSISESGIKKFKTNDCYPMVFAALENGCRKTDHFQHRSLIAIDIDQKQGTEAVSLTEVVSRLQNLKIDSIVYTSVSHKVGNSCFRIISSIGHDCDADDFKRATKWLCKAIELPYTIVDSCSYSPVQAMLLPCGYLYEKPQVFRINGGHVYPSHWNDVRLQVIESSDFKSTAVKNAIPMVIPTRAGKLYEEHVGNLHEKLTLAKWTSISTQFYRNSADKNPGLFSLHTETFIIDRTFWKTYSLQYSLKDYKEAVNHKPHDRNDVFNEIKAWEKSDVPFAVFRENPGTGKTEQLVKLIAEDPECGRRIFTFHTNNNMELFIQRCSQSSQYEKVYSNSTVLCNALGEERGKDIYSQLMKKTSWEDEGAYYNHFRLQLNSHTDITEKELSPVIKEYESNRKKIDGNKHLVMTTAKLELLVTACELRKFEKFIIYTDEVQVGSLTDISKGTTIKVYNSDIKIDKCSALPTDKSKLKGLKRCYLTVEKAFDYELKKVGVEFTKISGLMKTLDLGVEVLRVPTTSQSNQRRRLIIAEACRRYNKSMPIIVDGLKEWGFDLNHTNTKGLNDLSVDELVVILSHPAQEHVARVMICTGLDEDEAVSIIMGDNAIQAIGRSQGYRNKSNPIDGPSTGDNKTLVVIPNSVDVDLNNVTPNVVRGSSLKDGGKPYLSVNSSLLRKFHFKDIILDIFPVSDECGAIVSAIDSLGNSEQNVIPIARIAEETGISPKTVSKRAKELGYECKRLVIDGKRQQYLMAA